MATLVSPLVSKEVVAKIQAQMERHQYLARSLGTPSEDFYKGSAEALHWVLHVLQARREEG